MFTFTKGSLPSGHTIFSTTPLWLEFHVLPSLPLAEIETAGLETHLEVNSPIETTAALTRRP